MPYQVKNWRTFQHYTDRRPPWIKLHRTILDDCDLLKSPVESRAIVCLLWLLASESGDGTFTDKHEDIAFRLRIKQSEVDKGISGLISIGYISRYHDASAVLADCKQEDMLEREGEREKETEKEKRKNTPCLFVNCDFAEFDKFKAALPEWDEATCLAYWEAARDYSAAKGAKYVDWIAAVRNWKRKDDREGVRRTGQITGKPSTMPADKPIDQWTMYELNSAIESRQQALSGFGDNCNDPKNARYAEWKKLFDGLKRLKAERLRRG